MNRQALVAKATAALVENISNFGDSVLDDPGIAAAVVVAEIFPQASTVVELEALPQGSIVLTGNGYPWERTPAGFTGLDSTLANAAHLLDPIWQGVICVWSPS